MNEEILLEETFKVRLRSFLKVSLDVVVTENRSTMLNLLEKTGNRVRLSVHKMFLKAPEPILHAIAHYVRGTRKEKKERNQLLRRYIQEHLTHVDYAHLLDLRTLVHKGEYFDLGVLYRQINEKYFNGELQLNITWYGAKRQRRGARLTLGQYVSGIKLVKIHRLLDAARIPDYFISYIVYHEMLHSVIPGSVDQGGRFCYHGAEFKKRERVFEDYSKAIFWEKNNKGHFA